MGGFGRHALRVVLVGLLVMTLAADPGRHPAATAWEVLDPATVGLTADAGTGLDVEWQDHAAMTLRVSGGADGVALRLPVIAGERFFGLGARFGAFDLRGQVIENWTADAMGRPGVPDTYSPVPFLLSSRGYGLQLDTAAMATVDLSAPDAVRIHVAAPELVVHVLTGPDPATVLTSHAALVGLPPVPPSWGLGVWKSLVGGTDRVLADTDALRAAGVPLDAVWVYDVMDAPSGFGWPWPIYGPVPGGAYPDAAGLVDALHARGLRALGYLHPFLVPGRDGYADAQARGYLVRRPDGAVFTEPWMDGDRRAYVDFTDPDATAWWQDRLRHAIGVVGFDGAMQDYGEGAPVDGRYASGEPGGLVHNSYPVRYARAARAAAQSVKPDDTVLFARSGYDGAQGVTTGRFTGDQTRDWDRRTGLPALTAGMLSGGLSGWPYWGPDIGGFTDGSGARDRELWTRWVQLGALSPVMRDMLGAQADPVGVHTDASTLATFRGYALLHQALTPYLHTLAHEAHTDGLPLVRPLWLAAPTDPVAWTVADQYLLGPDLLVAPVVTPATTQRAVYLPRGRWRDYWTGAVQSGPRWIVVDAPAQQIPLFVRDSSTLELPPPAALGLPATP